VNQLRVSTLRPAARSRIDLLRKGAHGNGYADTLRGEERQLALPIEAGGGDRRVREPVKSDVVENIVARETAADAGPLYPAPQARAGALK
jgi:hypothetical protein